ncbi:MAG: PEP-CTERM/exosortase system-associated acyltransferase [Hahellaceae bacterium]|nr:PEP-CTERM/exosortase system-associated acyltransferase [Hahellaceae bacterium]MCP5213129.1 PEP-CTERM/exosortase system-associated acyltransferase [Hahellaceae bacterium]
MNAMAKVCITPRPAVKKKQSRIDFIEAFDSRYSIVKASTEHLKNECYSLRYKIYCEERSFESSENFPEKKEIDAFDAHSDHFLIQDKHSGEYTGTVRLINSTDGAQKAVLPIERYCSHAFSGEVAPDNFSAGSYAEISRLAVTRPTAILDKSKITSLVRAEFGYSLCTLALSYCCLARFTLPDELNHCFTMMEPRLATLLTRLGIKFQSVGNIIDYHGERAPFYWHNSDQYLALSPEKMDFLQFVKSSVI